ncbi:Putative restriction endonuclease [Neomoorella glycerini]|uniref:Restriction endonuclease n=1 Tax=Neomoorella glycerini TaxID=55779 RepID=A0A6I5ZMW5_9FIRM|nr:Uma2 family endonuclease [Moorella glycerini]QGP90917.1 Putative restriction endonuclease [Moorella glycerini]
MSLAWEEIAVTGGLTYEDYLLFPEDGRRHELIGGDHYMTPAPTVVHQRFLRNLSHILSEYVTKNKLGEVLFSPIDVVISPGDVVQPDLIFISNNRRQRLTPKNVQGAPDLVVEVISDASRRLDRKLKRNLYGRYDVLEYWLFDPDLRLAEIFRRDEAGRLVKAAEYEDEGELTSPLLPGLVIDLKLLWPEEV